MENVTADAIRRFLERLGERCPEAASIYLLGGAALCLLGSPRETQDFDYFAEVSPATESIVEHAAVELASEMRIDLESVPLAEFIPLPSQARERRQLVGHFGRLDVYIFDPYSIALSKIARGFEADMEDVLFMLRKNLIDFYELERLFQEILPGASQKLIDPAEFRTYFEEVRRRHTRPV